MGVCSIGSVLRAHAHGRMLRGEWCTCALSMVDPYYTSYMHVLTLSFYTQTCTCVLMYLDQR